MNRPLGPVIADAAARPAIPNRGAFPATRARSGLRLPPETRSGAVVITQPAAHGWQCDACGCAGFGGIALLTHYAETAHTRYTPEETR